jgi:hypothetical protein
MFKWCTKIDLVINDLGGRQVLTLFGLWAGKNKCKSAKVFRWPHPKLRQLRRYLTKSVYVKMRLL